MEGDDVLVSAGLIFVTTNMAPAVACVVTMIYTWLRHGKPDVGMTLNAALAGLVAITAGCDVVSPAGAAIIGIVAGLLLPISVGFFDNVAKIDDPVGAISVHGVCGAAGTLMTGLLSTSDGLFYGHGISFFLTQCIGVCATALWAAVMIPIVFFLIKHTIGLRVSAEEELKGLDITEHGLPSAYGGFAFVYDDTPDTFSVADAAAPRWRPPCCPASRCPLWCARCRWSRWCAKRVLYTGHIGDGKIFICDVENVIKVRTGEEGYDALQDAK